MASCPPKLCGELEAEENAQLVVPCYREFESTCAQVCVDGYYLVNGTSFERTCALQGGDDEVGWTDPGKCQGTYSIMRKRERHVIFKGRK